MNSEKLFAVAQDLMPGGVNSPVRAFRGVGGTPRFIKSARGATITDVDSNTYIDYVGSWGPMILGHADEEVVAAIQEVAAKGTSFGAPTELEISLAQEVIDAVPSIEMVRMVSSGTEATMAAIRLARGVTGRTKLIKFEGCYHGHADSLLVKAGSGVATLGLPDSPGVPASLAQKTIIYLRQRRIRRPGEHGQAAARTRSALQGHPRPSRTVDAGDANVGHRRRQAREGRLRGDDRGGQDRRGRSAPQRRRTDSDAARRHGRAADRREAPASPMPAR